MSPWLLILLQSLGQSIYKPLKITHGLSQQPQPQYYLLLHYFVWWLCINREIKYLGDISCTTIVRYHYLSNRSLKQLNRLIIQYCTWLISQNYLEATKSWIWWLHRSPDKIMIRFLIRFCLMAIFMADSVGVLIWQSSE